MTGEEIRKTRLDRGWSQKQMGDFLGIEQATVSRLEAGEWEPSGPVKRLMDVLVQSSASSSESAAQHTPGEAA